MGKTEETTTGRERLIFALDVPSRKEAEALADELADDVGVFKVGLELFVAEGPSLVRALTKRRPVFLDLKLHDIPETVDRAVARAVDLEVAFLTVHASGGSEMLERAAKRVEGTKTQILAVTVLTSSDAAMLASIGVSGTVSDHVLRLAKLASTRRITGFVASPHEVALLRGALPRETVLVIPGIRPSGTLANDDQKRAATPTTAIRDGASYLVVGRPIRDAKNRKEAARSIVLEIEAALR